MKARLACALSALLLATSPAQAEEADHAIHEELRGLLQTTRTAVNTAHYEDMMPVLADNVLITFITQEHIASRKDVPGYFASHFGPGKKLKSLQMSWEPDDLTSLSADKSWGVVSGKGTEDYTLNDGRVYHMVTRWTSTVAREKDGKWRIRTMHIGTNFLDNPIESEVEAAARRYTVFGIIGGLVVGSGLGFLIGRRR